MALGEPQSIREVPVYREPFYYCAPNPFSMSLLRGLAKGRGAMDHGEDRR